MTCPRCNKSHSYPITFNMIDPRINKKVRLEARCCKVCSYLWAEDEELLRTARNHLKELVNAGAN